VKSPRGFDLQPICVNGCGLPKAKGTLKLEVDVDPPSFF